MKRLLGTTGEATLTLMAENERDRNLLIAINELWKLGGTLEANADDPDQPCYFVRIEAEATP